MGIRDHYAAVWRSLYSWFLRTHGEPAAELYAAGAMGAASLLQLLAVGWIVHMTGLFDIGYLLRDRKFFLVLVALFLGVAHFCVARSLESRASDGARGSALADGTPARLGLLYLAGSGLAYLIAVATAFLIKWH